MRYLGFYLKQKTKTVQGIFISLGCNNFVFILKDVFVSLALVMMEFFMLFRSSVNGTPQDMGFLGFLIM